MKAHTHPKAGVTITWLGHSAFQLESPQGKIILIDPWLDNPKAPSGAKNIPKIDLILVSHGHSDHLGNTVDIAKRTNARVLCIYEIYLYLQSKGVQTAQGMNKGGTMDVDGIKVLMTDARHSSGIDSDGGVIMGGEATGWIVEFENGFTIYHAGDTSVFGDMKIIGELCRPDVAMLPIGDLYTMGPTQAAYAANLLKPRYIIGMHYGTFPALTGTPADLKKLLPVPMRKKVVELEPGESVTLA